MSVTDDKQTSANITVRWATTKDVPAIVKIGSETFAASFAHSMPAEHLEAYLHETYTVPAISAELENVAQNAFFVAEDISTLQILGFLQMKLGTTEPCVPEGRDICELHRIYVSVDSLSRGVGRLLVTRGLAWATNLMHVRAMQKASQSSEAATTEIGVWLGVWEENLQAQRFYKRFGFQMIGAHDFVMGDTKQTDFIMIKWFNQSK